LLLHAARCAPPPLSFSIESPSKGNTVRSRSITVPKLVPRNPFVAASRRRKAGAHGGGARRQRAQAALRRELLALPPDKPSP